ncbi:MAG: hypothetical protein O7B99_02180 [Planctomycetota bacterium]|nr:hypothetical protein [Planctomycetota bacterium]
MQLRIALAAIVALPAIAPPAQEDDRAALQALAVDESDPATALGLALWETRNGAVAAAAARLDALLPSVTDAALAERIGRERQRIVRWRDLRDSWFDWLVTNKKRLRREHDGKKISLTIERVEDGVAYLARNKAGLEQLVLEELDPGALAQQMGKRGDELAGDGWVRIYAYVLTRNDKWKKLLKGDHSAVAALRDDGAEDIPARMRLGEAAARVQVLARGHAPRSVAEAEAALAEIAALRSSFGDFDLIASRTEAFKNAFAMLNGRRFDLGGPGVALSGGFEQLSADRVKLVYEFDDAIELFDFRYTEYLKDRAKQITPLTGQHDDSFRIEKGMLRGSGEAVLRHVLGFTAPMTVRYGLSFDPPPGTVEELPSFWFMMGLLYDGRGSYAWVTNLGDLEVWKVGERTHSLDEGDRQFITGISYEMEIEHDGKKVVVRRDGALITELPAEHLKRGRVFLWMHSDLGVSIDRIEIEAGLDPALLDNFKRSWLEEQLAGF